MARRGAWAARLAGPLGLCPCLLLVHCSLIEPFGSLSGGVRSKSSSDDAGAPDGLPTDAATGPQGCPTGFGPAMVQVPVAGSDAFFCIDSTEVTQGQYLAFLED